MKQTSVEWLNTQISLYSKIKENSKGKISFTIGLSKIDELFKQAKEIEKEQIIEAHGNKLKRSRDEGNYEYWFSGLDYYNKAFKKTEQ